MHVVVAAMVAVAVAVAARLVDDEEEGSVGGRVEATTRSIVGSYEREAQAGRQQRRWPGDCATGGSELDQARRQGPNNAERTARTALFGPLLNLQEDKLF